MGRRLPTIVLAVLAAALLHVPAATAELVGNPCVGDDTEAGATMIGLTSQGSEPFTHPTIPPEHNFVITGWRVQVGPGIGPLQQQLVVSRELSEHDEVRIGESAVETVAPGTNEFSARIPVPEYAQIGLHGPTEALICHVSMNVAGRVSGDWATGETRKFEGVGGIGVPVLAIAELDLDADGYGDQTQDGCPASAALQTPCPVLDVKTSRVVKPHAVLIDVTTSNESAVQVLGQVQWQEKRPGGGGKLRTFGLGEKTPQMIAAGATGVFRLKLWGAIQRHLDQLPPKQTLRVKVRIGVTDVFHAVTVKTLNVRLHGRAD
ncbi:MAG TPA: hypothetical protein VLK37_06130 [Solirubrobacterales bacterium]|nr:hypothetical protein [Solirubrobacterales bacterium]